ncbi:DUF1360 domain-containing protein [Streptomyces sp. NPDC046831]|uniref:DUF1360 domain-containing protein n=1 Tax=Streptomyces sp. NPDC046831 TaxID=3154805 RepID=UPI0033D22AEF
MADGEQHYDAGGETPVGGYALLAAAFATSAALCGLLARRRGVRLPDRIPPSDLALLGAATFKASRLLAKDKVTSFLRAPFTRRAEELPAGEVTDEPRGTGVRRAVGDLVSCPFCVSVWVAGALVGGYACWPRATRLVCTGLGAVTVADWLQYGWSWTEEKAEG